MSLIQILIIVGSILVVAYAARVLVELIMELCKPSLELEFLSLISREDERLLKIADPPLGDLPHSIRLDCKFYRFHQKQYFWTGDEFWKTFKDGPWKWDSQQRYAGKNRNPGHFFALNRRDCQRRRQRTTTLIMINTSRWNMCFAFTSLRSRSATPLHI